MWAWEVWIIEALGRSHQWVVRRRKRREEDCVSCYGQPWKAPKCSDRRRIRFLVLSPPVHPHAADIESPSIDRVFTAEAYRG
jgi:hypothetical protein